MKEYVMPEENEAIVLEEEPVSNKWKLYALILAIVSVLMIVLYYATKGNN